MTENGSIRINISMKEAEQKIYEEAARAEHLTLSGLIRVAMKEHLSKKPAFPAGAPGGELDVIVAKLETQIKDIDAKLDAEFARFTPQLKTDANHDRKFHIIYNIIKNSNGIETGKIVDCTTWDRTDVTEIVLEMQKLGKVTKSGSKWSVA